MWWSKEEIHLHPHNCSGKNEIDKGEKKTSVQEWAMKK